VIDAALELLAQGGVTAVTPAAVGERAGLSRSGLYQYVESSAQLVALAATRAYERRARALAPSVTTEEWVDRLLRFSRTPAGRAVEALERALVPPECRAAVEEWRAEQRGPLEKVLRERGESEETDLARLYEALAESAGRLAGVARARSLLVRMLGPLEEK
jgi:AcrR family transcriptional regulator